MKKNLKNKLLLMVLILSIILMSIYGFSYAKYINDSVWDYYLKTKGFYFTSDYLTMASKRNVDNYWDGNSVSFNVKNSLNDLVASDTDINYRVECTVDGEDTNGIECRLNGTESNEYEGTLSASKICINHQDDVDVSHLNKNDCENSGYNYENREAEAELYFDIINTTDEEIMDITVNITVSSTSPYHKTISGNFILHNDQTASGGINMTYDNYINYDRLIISNAYSTNKCIKIMWNADNLIIDAKEEDFSAYATNSSNYINEIKLSVPSRNNVSYIFYKKNPNIIYDISSFSYENATGC